MPIEAWWPKLPPATTGWLRANNGDAVPDATIERIAAAGRPATADPWRPGPRSAITRAAASHVAANPRVFGSLARGTETEDSDVDLLVDLVPGTGLLGLAALERDLSALLEARVTSSRPAT